MDTISMFDVVPVTGTSRNGSRFCLVCALGSAPVMVAFVKPAALRAEGLLAALQRLSDKHKRLQVVVICLAPPTEHLRDEIRRLAAEQRLTIPLTMLPAGELPASLGIDPAVDNAVLLYRGRRIHERFENVDLKTFDLPDQDGTTAAPQEMGADFAAVIGPLRTGSDFERLDQAADLMLSD